MNPGSSPGLDGRTDIERAVTLLTEWLPVSLHPLARIAFNYRWCWMGAAVEDLFRVVDPAVWRRSGRNPRQVIEGTARSRLDELGHDRGYVEQVRRAWTDIRHDLERPAFAGPFRAEQPIAYVCAEFGIHGSLPCYSGGLGMLAGDLLKAASDLAVPMIGIGLMYRQGYFSQRLDLSGLQHLKTSGAYYRDRAAAMTTLHRNRVGVGADHAALALQALAAVLEACRVARLTRNQHVLLRLGELIWV